MRMASAKYWDRANFWERIAAKRHNSTFHTHSKKKKKHFKSFPNLAGHLVRGKRRE